MMVGGYVWGYLADRRGRRSVLVLSLAVNGTFGAVASLAPSFWLFLLLRFFSGVGVSGSVPVIFSYFSEFQPRLRRGAMISALATFWMAGNILAAAHQLWGFSLEWVVWRSSWEMWCLGSWWTLTVLMVSALLLAGGLAALQLPQTKPTELT